MSWKGSGSQVALLVGLSGLFVLALLAVMWAVTDWGGAKWTTAATIVQAVGTLTAVFVGGGFAFYRLHLLRTFHPHLTITHEVSHRVIGESYVHIAVTVTALNSSSVVVAPRQGAVQLQQIAPTTDEAIERLFSDDLGGEAYDVAWPTLSYVSREWDKGDLVIEPGEKVSDTYEFAVPKEIGTVLAYSFIEDPTFTQQFSRVRVWDAQTIYDMIPVQAQTELGPGADNAD